MDDTSDENVSVQIPTHWRIVFSESGLLKLFFSLYSSLPSDLSVHALTCLVQLASVRRTIFNNNERQQYLAGLVEGTKSILENPQKLSDRSNYHEFCRLIARLKSNYQLSELIRIDDYGKVIRALTEFTVQSLQMYQFSSNSIHYLLSFWQRMVVSVPYVKSNEQHSLDQFAPLIAKAYIDSRLSLVSAVVNDGLEDPFDDHSSLGQQLDQLSAIMRCEYDKTCQLLISHFDRVAAQYELMLKSIGLTQLDNQTRIQQGQLTWLVYLIGAAIGGRAALGSAEDHDGDGELVCRVLRLMVMSDEKLSRQTTALPSSSTQAVGCEKMEFAFLWHLEQFRKIYISDQVQKTSKVYNKLAESFNLNDESQVLAVYVRKIITNLKYWGDKERLVDETLTLLNDLCVGYTSVRKLVRLDETRFMLNNHTSAEFSFLGTGGDPSKSRCRTTFYTALTRLLSVELNDDESGFYSFMLPIEEAKTKLAQALQLLNGGIGSQEETKRAVVGLVRDLRGVAFASNTKTSYSMLFDLLYPDYFEIFRRAIEIWYTATELTSPVLKLMNELCHNRSQRLQFDMSSANAVLLFREASKLICAYGSRILSLTDVSKERQYKVRLKGISICFGVLKSALSGGYLNFGVFRLYEDSCLEDALNMAVRLLLVIPHGELLSYSKLSQNYYYMLECLAQDHCAFLSHLEKDIFTYLLQTLHDGLTAVDTVVVTGCCSTLDLLISYVYRRLNKPLRPIRTRVGLAPDGNNCLEAVKHRPETLRQVLSTILHVVMFEECRAQWSMSRPLLGLILLQEEDFAQVRQQAVSTQPSNKHQALDECFATLMEGVERNLTIKNKDRFTQNLSVFRRNVADILKYSAAGSGTLTTVASSVDMVS